MKTKDLLLKIVISCYLLMLFTPHFIGEEIESIRIIFVILLAIFTVVSFFIKKKFNKKILIVFLLSCLFLVITKNYKLIVMCIFMYSLYLNNSSKTLYYSYKIAFILYLLVVLKWILGIGNIGNTFDRGTLGFANPNNPIYYYYSISIIYIFHNYNDSKKIKKFMKFSILTFILIFYITKSDSSLVAFIIYTFTYVHSLIKTSKFKVNKRIFENIFIIFLIFGIVISFLTKDTILNSLSTRRLEINYVYLKTSRLTLIGNGMANINRPLLNSFIEFLLSFGLIPILFLNKLLGKYMIFFSRNIILRNMFISIFLYSSYENYLVFALCPIYFLIPRYYKEVVKK